MTAWPSSEGNPHCDLLPHVPSGCLLAVSPWDFCPISTLQLPATVHSRELHPCPGYVVLRQGWSTWFSLHLECYRSAAALSNSLKCFSCVPNNCPVVGIWPLLQFPHLPGAGPVLLTLFFFPFFLCPTKFCVDLNIPFWWSGTPVCHQFFCKIFCIWRYILFFLI